MLLRAIFTSFILVNGARLDSFILELELAMYAQEN